MKSEQAIEILRNNPVFWSRLGFCYDPPMADENGEPLVFDSDFDSYLKTHDAFADAGINIHTCVLHTGWVGVDRYDYSLCDRVLESIFHSGKVQYFIPRIKLNVPIDWCRQNPSEVCVYVNGPRDEEEIRALVGTLKHDYLGYDSAVGYYNANGWKDPRPNVGGLISLQSFSSQKWLSDAGMALERLIKHIENGPYADKILAYHIAYGACGESMPWGRQGRKFGDYGISNQKNFLQWGLKKYGSMETLLDSWGPIGSDIVPMPEEREPMTSDEKYFFRQDARDCRALDYDRFMCDVNTDALSYFGKIVKRCSQGKAVGAFYGYLLYMNRSAYAGHLGWQKILNSPDIDFFAAPKSYGRCAPGEPGGEMAPAVAINWKKLWVDECDNRTHLTKGDSNSNATNLEETCTVHLRELCKNISHNSGLWYMDLGKGWFEDDGIMKNIASLLAASKRIRDKAYRSVSEILVVADEEGLLHTTPSYVGPTESSLRNLQLIGAPIDTVFSKDLDEMDLSGIRLIVLLHPISYTEEWLARLRARLPKECFLLWHSKSNVKNGFDMYDISKGNVPQYAICEQNGIVSLSRDKDGNILTARGETGDFAVGSIPLSVDDARRIAELSGVHCYAPKECAVYADNRLLSFFPRKDLSFECVLKERLTLQEFYRGTVYRDVASIPIELEARSGMAFEIL